MTTTRIFTSFAFSTLALLLSVYFYTRQTSHQPLPQAFGSSEPLITTLETVFAELDDNNVVRRVIVVTPDVVNSGAFGNPQKWVRAYPDGRMRGKYPSAGDIYDQKADRFTAP